ncbi:MAG: N-acetylmuramoyl-L-alanine amidase [Bacteroidota bacterium]
MRELIQPKGIVLHAMSEYIHRGALKWYGKKEQEINKYPENIHACEWLAILGLSAHGFISPEASWIGGNVDETEKALHAGESIHDDLKNLNNHYLGIEILIAGCNDYGTFLQKMKDPASYSKAVIQTCIQKCVDWRRRFNIPVENIVRHSDVSGDDVRGKNKGKKDPGGGFPFNQVIEAVKRGVLVCNRVKTNCEAD